MPWTEWNCRCAGLRALYPHAAFRSGCSRIWWGRQPPAILSPTSPPPANPLLSDGHPVIGVDDAHLLDELSATLLHQLAIDKAVHMIATVRSGEAVPDAITSLWKDDHVVRVALTPFSKEQSVELVERVLGGRLEGLSADLMWDASGGNALFLRHLVQGAVESGSLRG